MGVRPAAHVGVLMETRPSALAAIAALSRLGAVAGHASAGRDISAAVKLGSVESKIITDPENVDAAVVPVGRSWCSAAAMRADSRWIRHGRRDRSRDKSIPTKCQSARVVPSRIPVVARELAFIIFTESERCARSQADHQLPVGAVGFRYGHGGRSRSR